MHAILRLLSIGAALVGVPSALARSCESWSLLSPNALPVPAFADWTTSVAGYNPGDGLTHILIAEEGSLGPNRWFTWDGALLQERFAPNDQLPFPGMHMGPSYSLCYDEVNDRLLCLSGNLVYELDGDRWVILPLFVPVQGAKAVYDRARGQVFISKGGVSYALEGHTLTPIAPGVMPPAREYGGLAYDPVRERVVLHGGRIGSTVLGDTWEWDGASWIQRTDVLSPTPAFSFAMAWDPGRQRIVRHGGRSSPISPGVAIDETWVYPLGEPWALMPEAGIGAKHRHAMGSHDETGRLLVVGGGSNEGGKELWISSAPLALFETSGATSLRTGDAAVLWVHAMGDGISYEWRHQGEPIFGAVGPALVVESADAENAGLYECFVSTPCEAVQTPPMLLTVVPVIPGDVDGDGDVDFADLNALLSNYSQH